MRRLRARGARGPQVGDDTFEVRQEPLDGLSAEFTAMVWSPDPSVNAPELWCLKENGSGENYATIDENGGFLTLTAVEPAGRFVPPPGRDPDSPETIAAFRSHVRGRWNTKFPDDDTALSDWKVTASRPGPTTFAEPGLARLKAKHAYAVFQRGVGEPDPVVPVAFVWVPDGATRAIWLHYDVGSVDGFRVVGETPTGSISQFPIGELEFFDDSAPRAGEQPFKPSEDIWDSPALRIERFRIHAVNHPFSPTYDPAELVLVDYWVLGES